MKLALITSQFNPEITRGLKNGAKNFLKEKLGSDLELLELDAPGAFEIPLLAQSLAETKKYAGIICLGAVIKGDTAHFEFISLGATVGLMQAMLSTKTPISFGILTTYTEDQATARSRNDAQNKGREAAAACLEMVSTLQSL